jgi:ABC-type multidrug transport system ATPase subunit
MSIQQPAIEISNLNKFYGKQQVLHDLSFSVERGSIFGFLGPNGSGKSTTIKVLCGLVEATSGDARILGLDIRTQMDEIRKNIGYMSQHFGLYEDLTVKQNLRFYGGLYGLSGDRLRRRLDEVIEITGIGNHMDKKAGILSGGWKQRLALGCAILHEPPVIFLDEPTAGIDPVARRDLWDLLFDLSSQGITLFVTTHYMDEAERCHKVAYIYEGCLIANGSSDELRALDVITPRGTRRLEIDCEPLMKAYRMLHEHPDVPDVTIFGAKLHLMVEESLTNERLRDYLRHGIRINRLESIDPTLEDVFVTLTQHAIRNKEDVGV